MSDFTVDTTRDYFKLMSVVDQVCIDLDLPSSHYGNKFLSWACIGLVDLKLDTANDIKTEILPISDVCTCELPGDYQMWTKVAIPAGQYLKMLAINDDLDSSPRTIETWNPSHALPPGWLPNGVGADGYTAYQFANHGGRSLIALSGGLPQTGQFKIVAREDGRKELLLDAGIQSPTIVLEYVGIGLSPCCDTIIDPILYEYVRAYIHFQWEKFGKRADKSEAAIQRAGRELWAQEMKVRGRWDPITPTDLLRISRKSYRLTNKI